MKKCSARGGKRRFLEALLLLLLCMLISPVFAGTQDGPDILPPLAAAPDPAVPPPGPVPNVRLGSSPGPVDLAPGTGTDEPIEYTPDVRGPVTIDPYYVSPWSACDDSEDCSRAVKSKCMEINPTTGASYGGAKKVYFDVTAADQCQGQCMDGYWVTVVCAPPLPAPKPKA